MMQDKSFSKFAHRRQNLLKIWCWIFPLLGIGLLALFALLFVRYPLLANPFEVTKRLEAENVSTRTLEVSAIVLPIVVIFLFVVVGLILLIANVAFQHERRYLKVLEQRGLLTTGASEREGEQQADTA